MSFFALLACFLLFIYYGGLAAGVGIWLSDYRVRGWIAMLVPSALFVLLWQMSGPGEMLALMLAAPLMGILLLGWFLIGAGVFLGSLVGWLRLRPWPRRSVLALLVVVPALLALIQVDRAARKEAELLAKAEAREAWRAQTLTGSFGGHSVTFPVQPNLSIRHACRNHESICDSGWSRIGLNQAEPDDLDIFELWFRKNRNSAEWVSEWCAGLPPSVTAVVCEIDQTYDFSFEADGARRTPLEDAAHIDLHRAPDQVDGLMCSSLSQVPRCYTVFQIAPGIRAIVHSSGPAPEVAAQEAVSLLPTIERAWAILTQKG